MNKIFFTSDTHFNHANIIKYCDRPFATADEMDKAMVINWNSKVDKKDIVYHLGDFCFYKNRDWAKRLELLHSLNGQIRIVMGDHGDEELFTVPDICTLDGKLYSQGYLLNMKIDGQSITLCHWCMRVWRKSHFNSWLLYGHSHGTLEPIGKSWDVGVDRNGFFPLEFSEIREIMNYRPDNFNLIKGDRNV
jgi:calcineurin-like phosphoesterase family protein